MTDAAWDDLVVVARIARSHGLRGEVILNPETDFPDERFAPGRRLLVRQARGVVPLVVRSVWFQKTRPVVGFEGIDAVEDADELAGLELRIAPDELAALPAGMFYQHDLVGCRVETVGGVMVGEVERVDGSGAASRLVVRSDAGEELIPLAEEMCPVIDTAGRRIVIAAPEGLLGLNETARSRRERRGRRL
ncbi:MAG: ribosome maturation factor RimM [Acidobacteria bacterium]|nr:ribosome maturation factor RimM [Acidobacteriota bacterium]